MELSNVLNEFNIDSYKAILKSKGNYYIERCEMLNEASVLFQSKQALSKMTSSERGVFLGKNSEKDNDYSFDVNLFGAPGGYGKVKSIISSKYHFLDEFFGYIPRQGVITKEQYSTLVRLFNDAIKAAGCDKFPFVLYTRLLAVTRPDTFVAAADKALDRLCRALNIKFINNDLDKYWQSLLLEIHSKPLFSTLVGNPKNSYLAMIDSLSWLENEESSNNTVKENNPQYIPEGGSNMKLTVASPLNQILYGPPGTGKTYHTIEAAVKAAEPDLYNKLGIDKVIGTTAEQRESLTQLYKELTDDNRIRFVTFHQSYGYEEFVEGLKAKNDDDGNIRYEVVDGVFKSICEAAKGDQYQEVLNKNRKPKVWKLSIECAGPSKVCDDCFEDNLARIGWGNTGDLNRPDTLTDENKVYFKSLGRNDTSSVNEFSQNVSVGDLVLVLSSKTSIKAVGVVAGEYFYQKEGHPSRKDYCHVLPVNWLAKNVNLPIVEVNDGVTLTQKTFYHLWRVTPSDVFSLLEKHGLSVESTEVRDRKNYVLIIDEINRGNISKIFGELITLIEPNKRQGKQQKETLELALSNSNNKKFSVPDNLHLIGTMNTADRSLAMMDTALRRRFDFIEMMPKPELLHGKLVNGIDLHRLLQIMNERIEVLYDREHTLGHAFFMPVANALENDKEDNGGEEKAFIELQNVFNNKIIPLLEEYFFEDWEKIRLVLGDNQKKTKDYQFVLKEELNNNKLKSLFGDKYKDDNYLQSTARYSLNKAAFSSEKAYKYIITGEPVVKPTESPED
jgi:5-methylcytosine-specific restriction protein B